MAEIASSGKRIRDGEGALARGEWGEARAIFEQELEERETVDALEGLSWAAWWVEDVATCLEARERAYRVSRRDGEMRRAAMLALWVADDYLILRGQRAIANGWFQRAARIRGDHRRRSGEGEGARDPGARAGATAGRRLPGDVRARGRGPSAGE